MENEYDEVNSRLYVRPDVALGESNQFLDRLETARTQGLDRIATTTHALGTDVPSYQGGLIGAGPSTVAQYQTPQVNQMVANLRATAQQQALNEQLNNLLAQRQQEYKEAYRNAYTTATTPTQTDSTSGDVEVVNPESGVAVGEIPASMRSSVAGTTVVPDLSYDAQGNPGYKVYDTETGELLYSSDETAEDINKKKQMLYAANALVGLNPLSGIYGLSARALNQLLLNRGIQQSFAKGE